jgi:CRISPR/Cas system Type II protein with McrA/HNH and RuvC-like nuclease domain
MNTEIRWKFFRTEGPKCHYCLTTLSEDDFEIDHFVPRSRGGGDEWENLRVACRPCNRKKRDLIWEVTHEYVEDSNGQAVIHAVWEILVMNFDEWQEWKKGCSQLAHSLPF